MGEDEDERRRTGLLADGDELPALPLDPTDPVSSLARGLEAWGYARLFVAAFEMDFKKLVAIAVAALPREMHGPSLERLAESAELPKGRHAHLYGVVTGIERGDRAGTPIRIRLVLPVRLPEAFRLLLENASRRAEDDPVRAYWVPLDAIARGGITVVDAETVRRHHDPFVVFRVNEGRLSLATEPGERSR